MAWACFTGGSCLKTILQVRRSFFFEAEKGKEGGGESQFYIAVFSGDWIRNKQAQKLVSVLTPYEQSWLLRCVYWKDMSIY